MPTFRWLHGFGRFFCIAITNIKTDASSLGQYLWKWIKTLIESKAKWYNERTEGQPWFRTYIAEIYYPPKEAFKIIFFFSLYSDCQERGLKYICLEKIKLIFFPSPEIWSSQPYKEYSLAFIGTLTILGAVNRMYKTLFNSVSVILGSFFWKQSLSYK